METHINGIPFKSPLLIRRVKATLIDGSFILALMFIIPVVFEYTGDAPGWLRACLLIFLLGVYEPLFIVLGSTPGQKLRSIYNTQKRINIFRSYARFFVKLLLGFLSFVTIHFNKQRRAIHDFAGHSVMIELE